jgi:predicted AAA+ superfamily ATPase
MFNPFLIPDSRILDRLRIENRWWKSREINQTYREMKRRLYFKLFMLQVNEITVKRAVILMGPRRVGKTVMMHQAIQELITQGIAANNISFIGIDNPIYNNKGLEELFDLVRQASGNDNPDGQYVFFDEIQYLNDWERHLKVLVDTYPNTKFIVSGSAAAALRLKSTESGAGRFHDFMLPPLTFQEFLYLQDLQNLIKKSTTTYRNETYPFYTAIDVKELNVQFFNYLNYGGYPEVIFNETIRSNMPSFIKSDIIDKVLLRDLPGLYGITNVQELNRFFTYLAYNTGKEFSWEKMAAESSLEKQKIRRYLEYLEAAFLIKVIHKIDVNSKHFKRITVFKIYLTNPSLRTALFSPIQPLDEDAGNMVETAIFSQWLHRENAELYYARWSKGRRNGEVDMVMLDKKGLNPKWCVEVKWSNRYVKKPRSLKSLFEFCHANRMTDAVVTSIDKHEDQVHDGIHLNFYPAAVYAFAVGANTLDRKHVD